MNRFGGPGLLLLGFNINDVLELPLGERYRKDLLRSFVSATAFRISPSTFRPKIEGFPTHLLNKGSGGPIAVHDLSICDCGNHGRHRLEVIVVPHHQEAPADEVVDLVLVHGKVGLLSERLPWG